MFRNTLLSTLLLITTVTFSSTRAQICPSPEVISPCTCNEAELRFYCSGSSNPDFDLKSILDAASLTIDDNQIFNRIYITLRSAVEIPENTIQTLKFKDIAIEYNQNLKYISPLAFNQTREITTDLSLASNDLSNEDPYDPQDVFNLINKFPKLQSLALYQNNIVSIPDFAFGPDLKSLEVIELQWNKLKAVGNNVFSTLDNLYQVDLSNNELTGSEFAPKAFEGISSNAEVNLEYNSDIRFYEEAFKPLLDNARSVKVGGRYCVNPGECYPSAIPCDEVSNWICQNVTLYQPKLKGFNCRDERYVDIWAYCASVGGSDFI